MPSGKTFTRLEIRSPEMRTEIEVLPNARELILQTIENQRPARAEAERTESVDLHGVLRAVHLDDDWLELISGDKHITVKGVGETVDDVIGPLVNRAVIVKAIRAAEKYSSVDIEPEE